MENEVSLPPDFQRLCELHNTDYLHGREAPDGQWWVRRQITKRSRLDKEELEEGESVILMRKPISSVRLK